MKRILPLVLALLLAFSGCAQDPPAPTTTPVTTVPPVTTTQATTPPPPTTQAPVTTAPPATTVPSYTASGIELFKLSFAGDCTFGDKHGIEGIPGTFTNVVQGNYAYPFAGVKDIFAADDATFVNLECALTSSDPTPEEMVELETHLFRFRGPQAYANILVEGSVEFASCANNHSRDYGQQGLLDTWAALENVNIPYASFGKNAVFTTDSGLKIGVFGVFFYITKADIQYHVQSLKEQGAELIVMSVHWGPEGTYRANADQKYMGHMAVDAGVDIVYGHHSHTLQPVEYYNGGVIYYSLGNFSFGGNSNPTDKDTAILQQHILRHPDGRLELGYLDIIPCRVSSVTNKNDYQPTPLDPGDPAYERILTKLNGTYQGRDLIVVYPPKTEKTP